MRARFDLRRETAVIRDCEDSTAPLEKDMVTVGIFCSSGSLSSFLSSRALAWKVTEIAVGRNWKERIGRGRKGESRSGLTFCIVSREEATANPISRRDRRNA